MGWNFPVNFNLLLDHQIERMNRSIDTIIAKTGRKESRSKTKSSSCLSCHAMEAKEGRFAISPQLHT
jgi:hypothetical protein